MGIIVCSGVWVSPAVARWQTIGSSQLDGTFLTMEQQSLLLAEAEKQSNQRLAQAIGADDTTNEDVTAPTINTFFWAEIEERFGGRGRRNQW
ncbi:MAG: hypothetical protein DCF22_23895 [Leptolyngbya sp.]|nr:MAG: hypothetical protein DCF22_23895 [Leptolyngbya sp.]